MGHGGAGWEVGEVTHPWDGHWVQGPWGRNCSCSPVPLLHPLWDLGCDTKRCRLAAKLGSSSFQNHSRGYWRSPGWVLGCSFQPGRHYLHHSELFMLMFFTQGSIWECSGVFGVTWFGSTGL